MVFHAIIPARFLSLMAHMVINIMLFWGREQNVLSCASIARADYSAKDAQLLAALSCSLLCTAAELLGFLSGLSMFTALPALFSIAAHVSGTITSSLFVVDSWSCDAYWYILGICSILPFLLEIGVVVLTLKCKVFV